MIQTTTMNGRPVEVAYIGPGPRVVAPEDAILIKVRYIDEVGGVIFLNPAPVDDQPVQKAFYLMRSEALALAKKHGFTAEQIRFSPKLEWVPGARGQMELRKLRIDLRTKIITVFPEAIEANRPKDYKQHTLDTLELALKFIGNGQWDEEEHPRDSDGKFTFAGNSDAGDAGDGFAGGLVATEEPPAPAVKEKVKVKPADFARDKIRLGVPLGSVQERFIQTWDDKIGTTPADFINNFLGGIKAGEVTITVDEKNSWTVNGNLYEGDKRIGDFTRVLHFNEKRGYSSFFKVLSNARNSDVGKQVLAGNVEMYQKLGFTKVTTNANLDVGGYAWAKYGYVPTQETWNSVRLNILTALGGGGSGRSSTSTYTPENWDEIGEYDQQRIYDRWKNDNYSEFYDSEVQNWHDSGESMRDAKMEVASNFEDDHDEWAVDALQEWREEYEINDKFPFSNTQILDAIELSYDDQDCEGTADAEISFDDSVLDDFVKADSNQPTLPGIEEPMPHKLLTDEMRSEIESKLVAAFENEAESRRDNQSPPDWLSERAHEYQEEYWDQLDDEEKFRIADRGGYLPEIEIENEDEDIEPVDGGDDTDILMRLAQSRDPKSIWAIADSERGKELLLGSDWNGVLNFNDKESMDRFNAYVGKSKKKKAA